jgi:hypothetical protein
VLHGPPADKLAHHRIVPKSFGVVDILVPGKTGYGLDKTRYFGGSRVEGDCYTFAIAYNLRRALNLA